MRSLAILAILLSVLGQGLSFDRDCLSDGECRGNIIIQSEDSYRYP